MLKFNKSKYRIDEFVIAKGGCIPLIKYFSGNNNKYMV